ncbi:MAG: hypothetical protein ACJAWI_002469 [Marinomonas primoryensis]|jgi:hypothetical protein
MATYTGGKQPKHEGIGTQPIYTLNKLQKMELVSNGCI